MYAVEGLEIRYGKGLAFAASELHIREGECVALLGPNGSGKTTLLKALNGLLRPSAGRLLFRGSPAALSSELRQRSVYLHQMPYILAGTVSYNVCFGSKSRSVARDVAERRAAEAMALLGLSGFERRRHRALSGGEAQRVALARALASGADVLLLDEPTASADSASRDLILGGLERMVREGATIVFSTHDQAIASALAGRVLTLERGEITEDRSTSR